MTVADLIRPQLAEIVESTATLTKVEDAITEELQRLNIWDKNGIFNASVRDAPTQWPNTIDALRDQDASLVMELLCDYL